MKSSDEMLDSLFERREKYMAQKKAKMQKIGRAASVASCFCIAALVGIGVWYSNIGSQSPVLEPDDSATNKIIIVTDENDNITGNKNTVGLETDLINVDDTHDMSPVGGGASLLTPLGCYYPISITTIDKTNTYTKGCFVYDRKEEMNTIIYELYDMMKYDNHTYHKMLWYVVQGLELSREDIEIYNDLVLEGYRLTEDQIDALLIEDESQASNALRSPYTLYSEVDNNIYRIVDLEKLTEAEFKALEFSTKDIRRFAAAVTENDDVVVNLSVVNDICEMAGIDPVVEDAVVR